MHNIIKIIKNIFFSTKNCDHRFLPKDVLNINVDPLCCYCKEPLSVLSEIEEAEEILAKVKVSDDELPF